MANIELKYKFRVSEEGKITIIDRKGFIREMQKYFPNQTIVGTFRKVRKMRSTLQNSFYWGITLLEVLEGLVDNGYDRHSLSVEIVHDFLVEKFLKFDLPSSEFSGEFITITKRSKELTTVEWLNYQDAIAKWAQEFLGITLSVPDEQKKIKLL